MSSDLLREATRAFRTGTQAQEEERGEARADETRRRILASLQVRRVAKLRRLRWVLPIAAVLVTSSAFAASRPEVSAAVRAVLDPEAAPPRNAMFAPMEASISSVSATGSAVRAPAASAEPLMHTSVATTSAEKREETAPEPSVTPRAAVRAARTASVAREKDERAAAPNPIDPGGEDTAIQALYLAAHQKHFVARDPAAALTAWDAYLAAAPKGRLATEARYNRGLCLARLGRTGEARSALEPFAESKPGSYRQSEAHALVEALSEP